MTQMMTTPPRYPHLQWHAKPTPDIAAEYPVVNCAIWQIKWHKISRRRLRISIEVKFVDWCEPNKLRSIIQIRMRKFGKNAANARHATSYLIHSNRHVNQLCVDSMMTPTCIKCWNDAHHYQQPRGAIRRVQSFVIDMHIIFMYLMGTLNGSTVVAPYACSDKWSELRSGGGLRILGGLRQWSLFWF